MQKMHRLCLNVIDIYISKTNYVSDADYNTGLIIGSTGALLTVVFSITVIVLCVSVRRLKAGVDNLKGE